MTIETKFDLGQRVYIINKFGENKRIDCKACNGKGNIYHEGNQFRCETCYGYGSKSEWIPEKWKIYLRMAKVGKVDVQKYRLKSFGEDRISYMVDETGVGSGTVHYEDKIFISEQEAQDECDRLNKLENL